MTTRILAAVGIWSMCASGTLYASATGGPNPDQIRQFNGISSYRSGVDAGSWHTSTVTFYAKQPSTPSWTPSPSRFGGSYSGSRWAGDSATSAPARPRIEEPALVPYNLPKQDEPQSPLELANRVLGSDGSRTSVAQTGSPPPVPAHTPPSAVASPGDTDALWKAFQGSGTPEAHSAVVVAAKTRALAGDSGAMVLMATAQLLGRGVPKDEQAACEWARRGAALGNLDAVELLGEMQHFGVGTAQNEAEALVTLQRAADAGSARAQWLYAEIALSLGAPGGADMNAAVRYAERAEATFPAAGLELGLLLGGASNGGRAADPVRAAAAFGRAASAGNALAQYAYGVCLKSGYGVTSDRSAAVTWFEKAAGQGLPMARLMLGQALIQGDGVVADPRRAVLLLQQAANDGETGAYYELGNAYADGLGVAADPVKAAENYRKGADAGDSYAQVAMSFALSQGFGVRADLPEAARLMDAAARAGNPWAQYVAGLTLIAGDKRTPDLVGGRRLLEAAAPHFPRAYDALCDFSWREGTGIRMEDAAFTPTLTQGVAAEQPACLYVKATRLNQGLGEPRDDVRALEYLKQSAELGYTQAELDLAKVLLSGAIQAQAPERMQLLRQAREWLDRAADHGNAEAAALLQQAGLR